MIAAGNSSNTAPPTSGSAPPSKPRWWQAPSLLRDPALPREAALRRERDAATEQVARRAAVVAPERRHPGQQERLLDGTGLVRRHLRQLLRRALEVPLVEVHL